MEEKLKGQFCGKCKPFHNWRRNAIHLCFPNGNSISTTWAYGTYSDNHDAEFSTAVFETDLPSATCEVMFNCSDKLEKRICKKYERSLGNGQPIGYLDISQWLEIVNLLAKEKPKS